MNDLLEEENVYVEYYVMNNYSKFKLLFNYYFFLEINLPANVDEWKKMETLSSTFFLMIVNKRVFFFF